MFRTFVLFLGGLALLWAGSSQAQEAVLGQLYGKGVHEYFSGDYAKAFDRLTTTIKTGSRDPRAFYFRGLACLKLGRKTEAEADFHKGADLESKDINKYYNVGRALERVQGTDRVMLESYRVQARMAAFAESEKLRKARYEAIQREEARVLQQQVEESVAEPAKQPDETIPAPAAEATPTEPAPEMGANPAGSAMEEKKDTGAADKPAAEDPFATKPAVEEKPATESKPTTESKPAAESKPSGKSILGALGKSLGKVGGDKAAGFGVKNPFSPTKGSAEKTQPANKPAENKAAEPVDPFAN